PGRRGGGCASGALTVAGRHAPIVAWLISRSGRSIRWTCMDRQDLLFSVGADSCAAWLYPAGGATAPIVVMAHGLSGTRRDRLGAFAERFAAAGIAALVFDHRGFGDSEGEQDFFDPRRQLEDWRAAIAFARSL